MSADGRTGRDGQHLGQLPAARSRGRSSSSRSALSLHNALLCRPLQRRREEETESCSVHPSFLCQLSVHCCLGSKTIASTGEGRTEEEERKR